MLLLVNMLWTNLWGSVSPRKKTAKDHPIAPCVIELEHLKSMPTHSPSPRQNCQHPSCLWYLLTPAQNLECFREWHLAQPKALQGSRLLTKGLCTARKWSLGHVPGLDLHISVDITSRSTDQRESPPQNTHRPWFELQPGAVSDLPPCWREPEKKRWE